MEIYYDNIEEKVLSRLDKAKQSVHVASAWFTNGRLLAALERLLKNGGSVEVLLVDDKINRGGLDFDGFVSKGGRLIWVNEQMQGLMHNKFCVIDGKCCMTGSFNWTNKATYNHENLVISDEEIDAQDFLVYFSELKTRIGISGDSLVSTEMLFKRVRSLKDTLATGDSDDVDYQCEKFERLYEKYANNELLSKALDYIKDGEFNYALNILDAWLSQMSQLQSISETQKLMLKMQIGWVRNELVMLEMEFESAKSLVDEFNRRLTLAVADLVTELMRLKTILAKRKMDRSDKQEDKASYKKAETAEKEFQKSRKQLEQDNLNRASLNVADYEELSKLYKRGVKLIHPDRFIDDPDLCAKATKIMQELNALKAANHLLEMRLLVADIESGLIFKKDLHEITDESSVEILEIRLADLLARREKLMKEIQQLYSLPEYERILDVEQWGIFIAIIRTRYELEIKDLKKQIEVRL